MIYAAKYANCSKYVIPNFTGLTHCHQASQSKHQTTFCEFCVNDFEM